MSKVGRPWVPNAIYQASASKLCLFLKILSDLPYMDKAEILFSGVDLFETEGPKQNLAKSVVVSEENSLHLHMYVALWEEQITPGIKF